MDGKLVLDANSPLASSSCLPLVGPFAEWEIALYAKEHSNLDLSAVNAVCVEFHGLSQSAS